MGMGECSCDGNCIESQVDVDTCLKLLSSAECRHLLRQLVNQSDNVAYLDDLVDSYIEWTDVERVTEDVRIQCHHHHLPALADAGLVDFDEMSGAVRYYPNEKVETLLDVVNQWEE